MADRIIKPDSGNDVVVQNNAGTRKIKVTNSGDVEVTGDLNAGGKIDLNGNELILDADADSSITADTDDQIDFRAGGADSVKIGNEDLTINDGNLVIGTAGHGINFHPQGGSNINLLDDYEEGTWNPTITGQTNPTSVTTTFTNGAYTKIGRLVICSGKVTVNTPGSSTGGLYLTLPFTASNNDSAGSGAEMITLGYTCAVYGETPNSIRVVKYDFTTVIIANHTIRLSYSFYTA